MALTIMFSKRQSVTNKPYSMEKVGISVSCPVESAEKKLFDIICKTRLSVKDKMY